MNSIIRIIEPSSKSTEKQSFFETLTSF